MSESWYHVPRSGAGDARDPRHPKYAERFEGYSSYFVKRRDEFIVRYFGESSAHEQTRSESDVQSLTREEAAKRLNDVHGTDYTPEQWENKLFA